MLEMARSWQEEPSPETSGPWPPGLPFEAVGRLQLSSPRTLLASGGAEQGPPSAQVQALGRPSRTHLGDAAVALLPLGGALGRPVPGQVLEDVPAACKGAG